VTSEPEGSDKKLHDFMSELSDKDREALWTGQEFDEPDIRGIEHPQQYIAELQERLYQLEKKLADQILVDADQIEKDLKEALVWKFPDYAEVEIDIYFNEKKSPKYVVCWRYALPPVFHSGSMKVIFDELESTLHVVIQELAYLIGLEINELLNPDE